MKHTLSIILFLSISSHYLFSQKEDSLIQQARLENYIRINYDNDFFNATDRYYTQGIKLSFIHPIVKYSPLSYALIQINKNALNYYGLHIEQDCFTPRSIRYDTIPYGERPYAAVFLSHIHLHPLILSKKSCCKLS